MTGRFLFCPCSENHPNISTALKLFTVALQPKSVASHLRKYRHDASQLHDDIDSGSDCGISAGNLDNTGRIFVRSAGSRCEAKTLTLGVEPYKDVGKEDAA